MFHVGDVAELVVMFVMVIVFRHDAGDVPKIGLPSLFAKRCE